MIQDIINRNEEPLVLPPPKDYLKACEVEDSASAKQQPGSLIATSDEYDPYSCGSDCNYLDCSFRRERLRSLSEASEESLESDYDFRDYRNLPGGIVDIGTATILPRSEHFLFTKSPGTYSIHCGSRVCWRAIGNTQSSEQAHIRELFQGFVTVRDCPCRYSSPAHFLTDECSLEVVPLLVGGNFLSSLNIFAKTALNTIASLDQRSANAATPVLQTLTNLGVNHEVGKLNGALKHTASTLSRQALGINAEALSSGFRNSVESFLTDGEHAYSVAKQVTYKWLENVQRLYPEWHIRVIDQHGSSDFTTHRTDHTVFPPNKTFTNALIHVTPIGRGGRKSGPSMKGMPAEQKKKVKEAKKKNNAVVVNVNEAPRPRKGKAKGKKNSSGPKSSYDWAIINPFNKLALGCRIPDFYPCNTATFKLLANVVLISRADGTFGVILKSNPLISMFDTAMFNGSTTSVGTTSMTQFTPNNQKFSGATTLTALTSTLKNVRVVAWSVEIQNKIPLLTRTGTLYLAPVPCIPSAVGPFMLGGAGLTDTNAANRMCDGVPVAQAASGAILELPGSRKITSDTFTNKIIRLVSKPTSPAAFNFSDVEQSNQWSPGFNQGSDILINSVGAVVANDSRGTDDLGVGMTDFILYGDGFPAAVNCLDLSIIYHVEGVPLIGTIGTSLVPTGINLFKTSESTESIMKKHNAVNWSAIVDAESDSALVIRKGPIPADFR